MVTDGPASGTSVYDDLRGQILKGSFDPGAWLREGAVAEQLGVSRTPVREALRRLHADGLVKLIPNRGAQVVQLSDADLDATYDLRAMLEGYGARHAAESGLADVAKMLQLCAQMEDRLAMRDAGRYDDITRLNLDLHKLIHRASGSQVLPSVLSGLIQVGLVRHTFHHYTAVELARSFAQHREVVEAIEAGDGHWAAAVMSAHILGARASLRRRLSQPDPPTASRREL